MPSDLAAAVADAHLHARPFRDSGLELTAPPSVRPLAEDLAAIHMLWRLTGLKRPHGSPEGERRGILLLVARKGLAGWRIEVAQNTDIVPGMTVPAAPPAGFA